MTNIYDEVAKLPRAHRLVLAGWILRTTHTKRTELRRVIGRTADATYRKAKS
jgi:hypothetical protein